MRGKDNFRYSELDMRSLYEWFQWASEYQEMMVVYSEYKVYDERTENKRQQYRASPYFQGHAQHDCAMFNLSNEKNPQWRDYVACQIKFFVDLTEIPEENNLCTAHGDFVPGMYALVEPTWRNPVGEEQGISRIIDPWVKKEDINTKVKGKTGSLTQLVNLERLLSPAVVVPDLGNNNPRAYLRILKRSHWAQVFEDWLLEPHTRDFDPPPDSQETCTRIH